jgi:hypothetical protein
MRISLELVVIAIIILVVAVVVLAIFGGGVENFVNIFNWQSEEHIKRGICANACSNYCFTHPDQTNVVEWGTSGLDKPEYQQKPIENCGKLYGKCDCNIL